MKLLLSLAVAALLGVTNANALDSALPFLGKDQLVVDFPRESHKIFGHVSAAFTPINEKGDLDFTNLEKMAARLQEWSIPHVMLGGTTGESVSFSMEERLEVVDQWLKIADKYDLKIYMHVGSDNVHEARQMATAAAAKGVHGIFCMPPVYFKPANIDQLIDVVSYVAAGAPDLPVWYYHFPAKTGVDFNMFQFIEAADASGKIPNLMGVKFTNEMLIDLTAIGFYKNKKYQMLFGRDEELVPAIATGAIDGDVSSTINFMSYNLPMKWLFNQYTKDAITTAAGCQVQTVMVIQNWEKLVPGLNVQKSILKMTGIDFGPLRQPQKNLSHDQEMLLGTALKHMGLNITDEYVIPGMVKEDFHDLNFNEDFNDLQFIQ